MLFVIARNLFYLINPVKRKHLLRSVVVFVTGRIESQAKL